MTQNLLEWRDGDVEAFGRAPRGMKHNVHLLPLFSDDSLIRLIDATPRENIHVNTMARDALDPHLWREGDLGDLTGRQVFEAVAKGNIWLHLRRVHETDEKFAALLEMIFGEIDAKIPNHRSYKRSMSVLVSSPKMSVAYHSDVPGQSLWHIRGQKRAYVYPARAPFLPQEALENIVLKRDRDTDLPFAPDFDREAAVLDMVPGDWATWPRACPHRVVNGDCLNISFTTEHWTDALRAGYAVDYANGLLRPLLRRDLPRRAHGAAALAKFALAGAHKALTGQMRRAKKPARLGLTVDFRVDPRAENGYVDIAPYQTAR